jgi:glutathione S-transferase
MENNKLIIGYWAIRGIAQVPRLLLAYTGLPFTQKNYTDREEWTNKDKQSLGLPFPNLPYLIDGNVKLTESEAISWYIIERSSKRELEGKSLPDRGLIGNINGVLGDIQSETFKLVSGKSAEEKEKTFTDKIKAKYDNVYKFLGDKDWLLGYLTFSDFKLSESINYLEAVFPEHYKEYPKFEAHRTRFNNLPEIKAYYASEGAVKDTLLPGLALVHAKVQ